MRASFLALIIIVSGASLGEALAADMTPAPAPPPPLPVYNWSGFYLGTNAGYIAGSGTRNWSINGGFLDGVGTSISGDVRGAIAGGQIGFNWQIGTFVVGAEADAQWTNAKSDVLVSCGIACVGTESTAMPAVGTVRARFGGAFDRLLVYTTGGMVWSRFTDTWTISIPGIIATPLDLSATGIGWTVGGGIEWATWNNLLARVECLYINSGTLSGTAPLSFTGGTLSENVRLSESVFRFALNYKFGGAPVVTRY
jgi:outer membrane immunogenic protein